MKSKPYKSDCICRVVRETARTLTNAYDGALSSSGLRTTQYALLSTIERNEVANVGELSKELQLDQTTTTRNVGVLEDGGYITRVAHHDPRVKLLKLTPKGKQARQKAFDCWEKIQAEITASLSEEELKSFRKTLVKINRIVAETSQIT